ncbi:MAG: histidinol-phosphate transaminase [Christensenellales bacterium]|jgi:histidinol-phosphate aminotransferase
MSRFLSREHENMAPYVPGEQPGFGEFIKLNTNESPFPPAPGVREALLSDEASRLNLYNDMEAGKLVAVIADFYGISQERIIAGNGSDEILAFCFMAFCGRETGACYPDISYGFYRVYAQLFGLDAKIVPLKENFEIDPQGYFSAGKTIFIANPNAPTGIFLELSRIEEILRANRENVVVIDEAYVDFGGESAVKLIDSYENLLVVQTFSKARNMAGARIGFAMAQKHLIDDLKLIKYSFHPYNVNTLSHLAGAAAMADRDYFNRCIGEIIANRQWTKEQLERRGFECTDSKANFIFAKSDRTSGKELYARLKEKKVLIRHFGAARIDSHVRISIGTKEQMEFLVEKIDEIFFEGGV